MATEAKVPTVISVAVICLALGAGAAVATMNLMGYHLDTPAAAEPAAATPTPPMGMGGPPGGGPPGGGPPGGMGMAPPGAPGKAGAPKGGMGRGPNPKLQLASLVGKLDLVTGNAPTVRLTDEQRKKVQEQLRGLDAAEDLSADEAQKRLDTLLEILKDHRQALELVGYRWPSQGAPSSFSAPPELPNPFKDEKNAKPLKSLQSRLEQPAGK